VERAEQIKIQITKIQNEIDRLEKKLEGIKSQARIMKIEDLMAGHKARIKKLENELEEIEKAKAEAEIQKTPSPEVWGFPKVYAEERVPTEEVGEVKKPRFEFEIGGVAGLFAAATGLSGEVRFPLPYILGPATSSLRISGGLMQSEDTSRRYAPVQIDGILNFPAGWFTGVENYLGAGLNYVVLTTGRKPGTIGGEIFYGVSSEGFGGKVFGEMGWGILRTGFSPSHKGTIVLIGYRREWGF
jgi:hypothetical protein